MTTTYDLGLDKVLATRSTVLLTNSAGMRSDGTLVRMVRVGIADSCREVNCDQLNVTSDRFEVFNAGNQSTDLWIANTSLLLANKVMPSLVVSSDVRFE